MINKIEKLDHFGRGIIRQDNKTIFVKNALDNETIEYEIDKEDKITEAHTIRILETSTDREIPKCPYYNECGGCNIMHMKYNKQLEYKLNKVKEILKKFGNIEESKIKEILPTNQFNYRNKITLKLINGKLGYYKNKTNELIEINECLLCSNAINKVIAKLKNIDLLKINEIVIRSNYIEETMIIIKGNPNEEYIIKCLKDNVNSIYINNKLVYGKESIKEKLDDKLFKISPESFFQVNTKGACKLYKTVKDFSKIKENETILDLYCGTGTIGIYVSNNNNELIGIEIVGQAVNDAKINAKENNLKKYNYICGDVSKEINKIKNADILIIDPPRSGLNSKSINNIFEINASRIIYVSCDPATLSRDLKELSSNYCVDEIKLIDMFPNTYHVESVVVLERK